jgi:hypothetical protein
MMASAPRQKLQNRRAHWLYRFECGGQLYTGGIGRFEDGRIAEIFINGSKANSTAETNAQDAAIIASLALQHGCPLETIRHALIRTGGTGGPLVTLLTEVERQSAESGRS